MRPPKPQGKVEREALSSAFEKIRAEWGLAPSFDLSDLLKKWKNFVQEVGDGYQLSIYDYFHDLEMRELLEEVKAAVPSRLHQEIDLELRPLDEKFFSCTMPSTKSIETEVEEGAGPWWFRIPQHAGPDVLKYLVEQGLLHRGRGK